MLEMETASIRVKTEPVKLNCETMILTCNVAILRDVDTYTYSVWSNTQTRDDQGKNGTQMEYDFVDGYLQLLQAKGKKMAKVS